MSLIAMQGNLMAGNASGLVQTLLSASLKDSAIALSNGDRTATQTGSGSTNGGVGLSVSSKSTGKYYVEIEIDAVGNVGQSIAAGIHNGTDSFATYLGGTSGGYASWIEGIGGSMRATYNNNTQTNSTSGASPSAGMRMRIALDASGSLWMSYFNSTAWIGGGDPAAGTSPTYSVGAGPWYIALCPRNYVNALTLVLPGSWANAAPTGFGVWT